MTEHPITPETAAAQEEWWDRSLTSAGRSDILRAAGLRLPPRVLWRHMSFEARVAVDHMRTSEFRPEDRERALAEALPETPATPDPAVTITELRVNNSLLRGELYLTAAALKRYHDARHVATKNPHLLRVTVPADYRENAADAITRANNLLKDERVL